MNTSVYRNLFLEDVENALEELSFYLGHLDNKEALLNIVQILHALRIAAITYNEYKLQRNVEELLAMIINNNSVYNSRIVSNLYSLLETMVYPYNTSYYISSNH